MSAMVTDGDARSMRILSDLDAVFKHDPNIKEYDLVTVAEPTTNRSPLIVIEQRLGIEMWCIRGLYIHAYTKLIHWRRKQATYLEAHVILSLTRAVLMVNSECSTAWNIRKELIERGDLNTSDDLRLNELILKKHAKSPESFMHRKWLLKRTQSPDATPARPDTPPPADARVVGEMRVCTEAADHYPCNYAAWSHRAWTLQHLTTTHPPTIRAELSTTNLWVRTHVSDHSGFHYRQLLLNLLLRTPPHSVSEKPCLSRAHECRSLTPDHGIDSNTTNCHDLNSPNSDLNTGLISTDGDPRRGVSPINSSVNTSLQPINNSELRTSAPPVKTDTLTNTFQTNSDLHYRDLVSELELTTDLISDYPEHQAIWYHRRYCVQELLGTENELPGPVVKTDETTNIQKRTKLDCGDRTPDPDWLARELDWLKTLLSRLTTPYLRTLVSAHDNWIRTFLVNATGSSGIGR